MARTLGTMLTLTLGTMLTLACGPGRGHGDDELADADASDSTTTDATATDSSSTDATSSTDSTSSNESNECSEVVIEIDPEPPIPRRFMLVVDASLSMATLHDHDGDPGTPELTRAAAATTLVEQILVQYGGFEEIGLQRFPSAAACPGGVCSDADACLLAAAPELAPAPDTSAAILAMLPTQTDELRGGSPASAAIDAAREQLVALGLDVPAQIVLISDGEANCGESLRLPAAFETYDVTLTDAAAASFEQGVPVFVVGVDVPEGSTSLPGVDSPWIPDRAAQLDAVALAGGVPWDFGMQPQKFFDLAHLDDLLVALAPLEGVVDCTIDLTMLAEGPPDPVLIPYVTVEREGMLLPLVEDCASEDGWTWVIEGQVLALCGFECSAFLLGAGISILYPCLGGP